MVKALKLSALVLFLLLTLLSPASVQASDGLKVLSSTVELDFPMQLNFKISAEGVSNITDIRLHYRVERMSFARVTAESFVEFKAAPKVEAGWTWDMRRTGGLPPGSSVEYWWTVKDAGGNRIETKPEIVPIEDRRYRWQSLTEGKVTLYWYEGDNAFAQALMTSAGNSMEQLAGFTGARLENPIKVYIYANADDLKGSMIFPQDWTGGVAFTEYGILAIGIAPKQLDWGVGAMTHELTHLVIHQVTANPYNDLPTWLDEGLAMYAEGSLQSAFLNLLAKAVTDNTLISVRSLASPFSAYADESLLAYAESYSVVEFLTKKYGQAKMFDLLTIFRNGSGYDEALVKVYGFDTDGLNTQWREYVSSTPIPMKPASAIW